MVSDFFLKDLFSLVNLLCAPLRSLRLCVGCLVAAAPASIIALRDRSEFLISGADVAAVANGTPQVFIGAYDGEGFLVWRPTAE